MSPETGRLNVCRPRIRVGKVPGIAFRERDRPGSEEGCENPDQRGDVALATQLTDKPAAGTQGLLDGAECRTRGENPEEDGIADGEIEGVSVCEVLGGADMGLDTSGSGASDHVRSGGNPTTPAPGSGSGC